MRVVGAPEEVVAGSGGAHFGFGGEWGLTPSPAGGVYEQGGAIIAPSNAPAGQYHLALAISHPCVERADQFQKWMKLPVTLAVKARPQPTKGP